VKLVELSKPKSGIYERKMKELETNIKNKNIRVL
jgi:hypothetical protein